MGSSVYFIFLLIYFSTFSPIASTDYSYFSAAHSKADGHYFFTDFTNTKEPLFVAAMVKILKNDSMGIGKSILRLVERNTVLQPVGYIFLFIPFKIRCIHFANVIQKNTFVKPSN